MIDLIGKIYSYLSPLSLITLLINHVTIIDKSSRKSIFVDNYIKGPRTNNCGLGGQNASATSFVKKMDLGNIR